VQKSTKSPLVFFSFIEIWSHYP